MAQIAPIVSLDTNHANAFVTAGFEKCWTAETCRTRLQ